MAEPTCEGVAARSVRAQRRIRDRIVRTPLLPALAVSGETGSQVLFKAENFQRTGSFKIRGALSKLSSPETAAEANRTFVTASSGNHGIASSQAAALLDVPLRVVLPEVAPAIKVERIRSFGIEVVLHGPETGAAERFAREQAGAEGDVYISPYNDVDVMAGQGTIGLELLDQADSIDNVFVAMGGGGLIGGIGSVLKSFGSPARIWGVSAKQSAALDASLRAGRIVEVSHGETFAEAVAGGVDADSVTFPIAREAIDECVVCSEEEIGAAFVDLALKERQIVEGAAALAYAGFLKVADRCRDQTNVIVLCGSNIDPAEVRRQLAARA